jgi:hypothetical protein
VSRPPFIDEHAVVVAAPPAAVWAALGWLLRHRSAAPVRVVATVLGTDPRAVRGDPLEAGSTIPGFTVTEATPERRLELTGRHRFSEYQLIFELSDVADGTRLAALSYARFPGPHGRAYRALVIGTRGHRVAVRRLLRSIARTAEQLP